MAKSKKPSRFGRLQKLAKALDRLEETRRDLMEIREIVSNAIKDVDNVIKVVGQEHDAQIDEG